MDALLAAVAQMVEDRRFGEVAGVLDNAELEVSGERGGRHPRSPPCRDRSRFSPLLTCPLRCVPQEPSALSSEQWPHALHLLAHIYASRL